MRRPPLWLAAILVAGIVASGAALGHMIGSDPYAEAATTETSVVNHTTTRRVRVVRHRTGRIVTLAGGTRVVLVHRFVVRTATRTITVPEQTLPLTSSSSSSTGIAVQAAVDVPVTVTIYVPQTIYLPTTVTSVATSTETILSTITLPLVGAPTT